MGQFALDLAAFAKKAEGNANAVVRKVFIDLSSKVILRTPVDTGRARANWVPTIGAPASSASSAVDPTGNSVISAAQALVATFQVGPSLFLVNNLPYINKLEYDSYSKQAPAGMLRITVSEFQALISRAAAEVK